MNADLLINSIIERNLFKITYYLSKVSNLNLPNKDGCLPLSMVAGLESSNDVDFTVILALFIDAGANVNATNARGETALMYAAIKNRLDNLNTLIQHRAHVDTQDNKGQTALIHASSHNSIHCIERLIRCGASVNLKDKRALGPLDHAVIRGNLNSGLLLIKNGAAIMM